MIGLYPSAGGFFFTLATCMLVEWSAASVGMMMSSVSPSYAIAVSISGPLLTMFSLTGGLYTNVGSMPDYVSWVQYLSWFRYGYESLIVNQWQDFSNITCLAGQSERNFTECEHNGELIIKNLSFDADNRDSNLVLMLLYVFGVFMIGYVGLVARVILAR
ncbi:CBR-WHT-8 protein, partial [Aphelenchoides avenae]